MNKNGGYLNFYRGKNHKAVLLVHGFTGNIHNLDIFFNYFKAKGYTVIRPVLAGHHEDAENIEQYGPEEWVGELRGALKQMPENIKILHVIGVSFGGNLVLRLGAEGDERIKSLVLVETPLFFKFWFRFLLKYIMPIFIFIGKKRISKQNKFLYRRKYQSTDEEYQVTFLPLVNVTKILKFIKHYTLKDLPVIKQPCLIVNAEDSDLLTKHNFIYLYRKLGSRIKKRYIVPIDNHDLDLLDEPGKIQLVEKAYNFIKSVEKKCGC